MLPNQTVDRIEINVLVWRWNGFVKSDQIRLVNQLSYNFDILAPLKETAVYPGSLIQSRWKWISILHQFGGGNSSQCNQRSLTLAKKEVRNESYRLSSDLPVGRLRIEAERVWLRKISCPMLPACQHPDLMFSLLCSFNYDFTITILRRPQVHRRLWYTCSIKPETLCLLAWQSISNDNILL